MASANIEQAFNVYLRASTAAHDVAADRYYWMEAPQKPTLPYVSYFVISDPHMPFAFNRTDAGQARIQFNIYDDNKYVSLTKANALRDVLDQYTGVLDSGITLENITCGGVILLKIHDLYQGTFDAIVNYYD